MDNWGRKVGGRGCCGGVAGQGGSTVRGAQSLRSWRLIEA